MGTRAIIIVLLMLSVHGMLHAGTVLGGSLALRSDPLYWMQAEAELHVDTDGYRLGVAASPMTSRLSAMYSLSGGGDFRMDILSSAYHNWALRGGMATASCSLGQDLDFSGIRLDYRLGIIGGLAYCGHVRELHFSLSPNLILGIGYFSSVFSARLYLAFEDFYETSFQSVPVLGLETAVGFLDYRLTAEGYMKFADYMDGTTILISDLVIRLGCEVML